MTGPALDLQDTVIPGQESTETQQQDTSQQQTEQTPPTPGPTDLDYRALYQDSARARIAAETELERLRQEALRTPASQEPDITDDDVQRSPAQAMRTMMQRELKAALGPVNEISDTFRVNQQMANAESVVFNAYPNLAPVQDYLKQKVRIALKGATNVDPSIYNVTLHAIIGEEAARHFNPSPAPTPTPTPPVPSGAPAPKPGGNPPPPAPGAPARLTEVERGAMRKAGYDPNKPADVKTFFDIVNNDEGISV